MAEDQLGLGQTRPGFRSGFASVIGRPNVGKSTLVNQILRTKVSITSSRAQTTRNAIRGVLTDERAQVVFIDTPGLHKPRTALGDKLNSVVRTTLGEVDAVVFLLDASEGVGTGDAFIARELAEVRADVIVALNKIDLASPGQLGQGLEAARELGDFASPFGVSARTGDGTADLVDAIVERLPEGPMYYPPDAITDQPEAMLVGELIREKALERTHEEVPHSIAVVVEDMRPRPGDDLIEVDAIVYVERSSQKGIVIGKGGKMLQEIGTTARKDIEALLGNRVYLHLRVKVERDWQKRAMLVDRFGYGR